MQTIRKRVVVTGRVQGVWFRQSAQQEAMALGVSGWVRNLPDGSVEAVFEGPSMLVDAAVEWASHGPERATVDHITVTDEDPLGSCGFEITG